MCIRESLEGFVKTHIPDPLPKDSDSVGLGWSLIICISNDLTCHTDVVGSQNTLNSPDIGHMAFQNVLFAGPY